MDTEVRDYYLRALESEETDLKFLLYYKILTFFYEKSKKNIEEKINKPISVKLIKGEIKSGDIVRCKMDGDNIKFEVVHRK